MPVSQTLHIRLLDRPGGTISAVGGFTVAYRACEIENNRLIAEYAYAECSSEDNYCRAVGRRIATARLKGGAVEFSSTYALITPPTLDPSTDLYRLDSFGTIDITTSVLDVRRAVLKHFVQTRLVQLYSGDIDFASAVVWNGNLPFINMEALYSSEPEELEDVLPQIHALAEKLRQYLTTCGSTDLEIRRHVFDIAWLSAPQSDDAGEKK